MVTPTRGVSGPKPGGWDCDRLWDAVLRPVIEKPDYLPVRADVETGSVIVKDMLPRLAQAHLLIADVTLPNGDVYYEHARRLRRASRGCGTRGRHGTSSSCRPRAPTPRHN